MESIHVFCNTFDGTAIATTEYGTLKADTSGSISGSGATGHSNIHY